MDLNHLKYAQIVTVDDIEYANDLLSRYHYLGAKKLEGEYMRYRVTYRGAWVAVLYFEHVTLHSKLRDLTIGWSIEQRKLRNKYLTKNCRFMIVPEAQGIKNIGSRILSVIEKRISVDWQQRYGHPILGVETYVDPEIFEGSCYKGAGWTKLGLTTGYTYKPGDTSRSKYHFIKPLHEESFAALRGEFDHPLITGVRPVQGSSNNRVLDPNLIDFKSLSQALSELPDPRGKQGMRYGFLPVLSLAIAASLGGYSQYRQIAGWIGSLSYEQRRKAGLRMDRKPSESMIGKLFRRIDAPKLEEILSAWLLKHHKHLVKKHISVDGKHLRATASNLKTQQSFLNVYVHELGIVINQEPMRAAASERRAALRAIKPLEIAGSLVTADAIHTTPEMATALVKKKRGTYSLLRVIIPRSES